MTEVLLKVEGLEAWYGDAQVLRGVSLEVRRGEIVALLGRNGVGKTTTLKAIMGVLAKRRGRVRFKDRDLFGLKLHQVARLGLGFVPEERAIFSSLTVMENLMLPPVVSGNGMTVMEILERFPNLALRSDTSGGTISGGEQQMLAIARILRAGADMLLLDEPTEGLAPVIVQQIEALLMTLRTRGMTVLMVEQNFGFARRLADRMYVMEGGAITDAFDTVELASRGRAVHEILGL